MTLASVSRHSSLETGGLSSTPSGQKDSERAFSLGLGGLSESSGSRARVHISMSDNGDLNRLVHSRPPYHRLLHLVDGGCLAASPGQLAWDALLAAGTGSALEISARHLTRNW